MSDPTVNRNAAIFLRCIVIAMLLLGLVAVIVPPDVIKQYRVLHGYVAASGAVIPGIERLAAVSAFPEVTRLVVSMMWTLVAIFTAVFFLLMRVPDGYFREFRRRPFFLTLSAIMVAIMVVLFAVLHEIKPEDLVRGTIGEGVLRSVSTSRIGLGLIAGFFSAVISAMLYLVLVWLLNLRRIYFSGTRRGR